MMDVITKKGVSIDASIKERQCALCEEKLSPASQLNICSECIKLADCCIGLERLEE